jgi:formylglycine-generating enzyme required for sulfatase activity
MCAIMANKKITGIVGLLFVLTVYTLIMLAVRPSGTETPTHAPDCAVKSLTPAFTNSQDMVMVYITPQRFSVGSTENQKTWAVTHHARKSWVKNEGPVTPVVLTYPYWIGQTEVTVDQYRRFTRDTGYQSAAHQDIIPLTWTDHEHMWQPVPGRTWEDPGWPQAYNHPVVCLTWHDARAYCAWLTQTDQSKGIIGPHLRYRLPTEAEWQYACRNTQTTHYAWGNDPVQAFRYANILDATPLPDGSIWKATHFPWQDGYAFTAPVATFAPNAFGLYDMHGNAWEWCENRFYTHTGTPLTNPVCGATWGKHMLHGGSWDNNPGSFRCTIRRTARRNFSSDTTGFRVVLVSEPVE